MKPHQANCTNILEKPVRPLQQGFIHWAVSIGVRGSEGARSKSFTRCVHRTLHGLVLSPMETCWNVRFSITFVRRSSCQPGKCSAVNDRAKVAVHYSGEETGRAGSLRQPCEVRRQCARNTPRDSPTKLAGEFGLLAILEAGLLVALNNPAGDSIAETGPLTIGVRLLVNDDGGAVGVKDGMVYAGV